MKKVIDFRSDTVTKPSKAMRKAMYEAEVGDDVLQEDPTVNKLEGTAAELLGKEDALLVPSGTFGNQVSVLTHCKRGDEVILSETSHIVEHEVGAVSVLAGANLRVIPPRNSYLTWEEIEPRIRKTENIHFPDTGLIELENALSNGDVQPLDSLQEIKKGAANFSIPVHLDGARIFNAALSLGVDASEIAAQADSVMFCLSKGLAAPIGSMVAGSKPFIKAARKSRKIMGGGMRQAGIIAAAGLVALTTMRDRLKEDHENARKLVAAFAQHDDVFDVRPEMVKINMVFLKLKGGSGNDILLEELLRPYNVITYPREGGMYRFVTHYGITAEDIDAVCKVIPEVADEIRSAT